MQINADRTMGLMQRFVGSWTGEGQGQFPTMDPFDYDETLTFKLVDGFPILQFEQRAIVTTPNRPSHFEVGVMKVLDDGTIQLGDIGNGVRGEIMEGTVAEEDGKVTLNLTSIAFANDARMIASRRVIVIKDGILTYKMFMTTATTPEPQEHLHLSASLTRG